MNLIYLHQYFKFPDESGGTRSYDLATSFVREGYKVIVITSTSNEKYNTPEKWKIVEREGIELHYIYLPYGNHLSYFKRSWVFFKFLWLSSFRLLKLRGELVLATSTPLTISIPALIKKLIHGTQYIFEVRDVWPEAVIAIGAIKNRLLQKLLYGLEKLVYKNATAVVPLSTDMQKSIVSRFPQFKQKTDIVIENIAEINRFQNISQKINLEEVIGFTPRFSILYAGTFGKVNGVHKVVELAKKTISLDSQLVYILVGSGAEKEAVIMLAKESGVLGKNVFILEPISKSELPLWYNAVSIGSSFVIDTPELWANSANKFFDTLAAGRPVLINHEGWQGEIIRSKNVGYVLPYEITDEIAQKFVNYTKDSAKIEVQGINALKLAEEKYSLEVATQNYLRVFQRTKS
ncbi:glycosyltransferase family 4 protein [Sphingobacterium sp. InxBP1]|uniref:glycosyltransferase family 4 protein n=1 Tax=Sphingobacterium sp. InxBP1 TaxID=2870328 RepID=UPI002244DE26|nr:glycosyltransferase family 4 protein [Sphingobacterium sp. InxBP1]MCW8310875.1 glycosyltransferase family 4 protein [Sphingobacterium sp. InxBP1]